MKVSPRIHLVLLTEADENNLFLVDNLEALKSYSRGGFFRLMTINLDEQSGVIDDISIKNVKDFLIRNNLITVDEKADDRAMLPGWVESFLCQSVSPVNPLSDFISHRVLRADNCDITAEYLPCNPFPINWQPECGLSYIEFSHALKMTVELFSRKNMRSSALQIQLLCDSDRLSKQLGHAHPFWMRKVFSSLSLTNPSFAQLLQLGSYPKEAAARIEKNLLERMVYCLTVLIIYFGFFYCLSIPAYSLYCDINDPNPSRTRSIFRSDWLLWATYQAIVIVYALILQTNVPQHITIFVAGRIAQGLQSLKSFCPSVFPVPVTRSTLFQVKELSNTEACRKGFDVSVDNAANSVKKP